MNEIDNTATAVALASTAFLAGARVGVIAPPAVDLNGDPVEIAESEIENADYMTPEDLDAWDEHAERLAEEDRQVEAFLIRMQDEEDFRNQFWD